MDETMTMQEFISKARTGKTFSCEFIKRGKTGAGDRRRMVCRTGVTRYVNGIGMKYNPAERNLLTVWDFTVAGYRMINLDWMIWVKVAGKLWGWNPDRKLFEPLENKG